MGPNPEARFSPWRAAAVLALVGLAFAAGVVAAGRFRTEPVARNARFALARRPNSLAGQIAFTPDGSRVVFGQRRPSDGASARLAGPLEIARAALPTSLFVSPDGQWVGYVDEAVGLM